MPVPIDDAKHLIGGGAKAMFAKAIDEQGDLANEDFRKLYKQMLACYGKHCTVHTAPFPHSADVLAELHDRGWRWHWSPTSSKASRATF